MHHLIRLLALCVLISLSLPHPADARGGGGKSMGSRGSQTYSTPSYNAAPISRSATAPSAAPAPGQAPLSAQPGMGGGFWSGLGGGFLGAGLGSMLFGHGGGYGGYGGGGGGFMELLLFGALAYFLYRRFRGRINPGSVSSFMNTAPSAPSSAAAPQASIQVTDQDKQQFEQLLLSIQAAWSAGDLTRLRAYLTPEMVHYFSEELAANTSRGVVNKVENVQLLEADVLEAWSEYGMDYATARLRWSAFDTMVPLDGSQAQPVSGTLTSAETAEEIWTFIRAANGGHWLLSAIQQVT